MIVVVAGLLLGNQITTYTTKLMNMPSTLWVNVGLFLTLSVFFFQGMLGFMAGRSIYQTIVKHKKTNNNLNHE